VQTLANLSLHNLEKYRRESALQLHATAWAQRKRLYHKALVLFLGRQIPSNNRKQFAHYQETFRRYQETQRLCFLYFRRIRIGMENAVESRDQASLDHVDEDLSAFF
jgi:hypothetical protein